MSRRFMRKYLSPFFGTDSGRVKPPFVWVTLFMLAGLGRRIELADAKAVVAVESVNALKATMTNRFWDVFKQILIAAILAGAAVLIYAAGTSGTTATGRMPKAPGSQADK